VDHPAGDSLGGDLRNLDHCDTSQVVIPDVAGMPSQVLFVGNLAVPLAGHIVDREIFASIEISFDSFGRLVISAIRGN